MHITITLSSMAALFIAMAILAAVPSVSVLMVTTRSASLGFIHGVYTTIGIVSGDIFYILLAIFGLVLLADTMGNAFVMIKYLGGAYLIFLGVNFWWKRNSVTKDIDATESSLLSSFLAGLLVTLADQKAILFYLGFFPAFLDLSAITLLDTGTITGITIVAVGGVKMVYAYLADRASFVANTRLTEGIKLTAGCVLVLVGLYLILVT
jgi:threonine/homoserine/homoserine lactone efflux protein